MGTKRAATTANHVIMVSIGDGPASTSDKLKRAHAHTHTQTYTRTHMRTLTHTLTRRRDGKLDSYHQKKTTATNIREVNITTVQRQVCFLPAVSGLRWPGQTSMSSRPIQVWPLGKSGIWRTHTHTHEHTRTKCDASCFKAELCSAWVGTRRKKHLGKQCKW